MFAATVLVRSASDGVVAGPTHEIGSIPRRLVSVLPLKSIPTGLNDSCSAMAFLRPCNCRWLRARSGREREGRRMPKYKRLGVVYRATEVGSEAT